MHGSALRPTPSEGEPGKFQGGKPINMDKVSPRLFLSFWKLLLVLLEILGEHKEEEAEMQTDRFC